MPAPPHPHQMNKGNRNVLVECVENGNLLEPSR